jgi:hypothetical protein
VNPYEVACDMMLEEDGHALLMQTFALPKMGPSA